MASVLSVIALCLISIASAQQQQNGRCDVTRDVVTYTRCTECIVNLLRRCPQGTTQTSTGQGLNDCTFRVAIFTRRGCRHSCSSTVITERRCCNGYWGTNCDRKCLNYFHTTGNRYEPFLLPYTRICAYNSPPKLR